ncbi:MAG TPA: ATP-binding protein [Planctomycetota bacterium]|jgi:signal transduction histidine kinase/CheY-like chemotaxis protein|nr:ATP-binding protein [Planctomycetota bacterium]
MKTTLLTLELKYEPDIVAARQRARQIASLLSFDTQDQTRLATAVSEIVRNAFEYAGGGKVEFLLEDEPAMLSVRVSDRGPGIPQLTEVLQGQYVSRTGMGLGILGARRLMDRFDVQCPPGQGTTVVLGKRLTGIDGLLTPRRVLEITEALARQVPDDPFQEVQRQNQELLRTLDELKRRQEDLARLNSELEDTNRGVVALYAELDEKADYLRRAYDVKSKFLSNMSHEFRTPLNSILSISRILLDRMDGDLTSEQEKQVEFVRKSAETLSELVNDLLDLAKVEAGKLVVRPGEFNATTLFSGLRGMLKPLLAQNSSINLIFDDATGLPALLTDEGKVSQILRNFISNALKYTEHGEVRVTAARGSAHTIVFSVKDQGIGIAPEHLTRIFDEFHQVEGPLHKKHKGTGLGLPLSKKLAELLGGVIRVESKPGVGSTFSAEIPTVYSGPQEVLLFEELSIRPDPSRVPVLVVEDNRETLFVYEKYLKGTGFQAIPARNLSDARRALEAFRPAAILLDVLLEYENTWSLLSELKSEEKTRDIPVIVVTTVDNQKKASGLGAEYFAVKPVERAWLLECLRESTRNLPKERVLIIDDDEASRYVLRSLLSDTRYGILEASGGEDGLKIAAAERPDVILLDLFMPGMSGVEVLDRMSLDPVLRDIPVILNTSKVLPPEERGRLMARVAGILTKDRSSHEEALGALKQALLAARSALAAAGKVR